MTLTTAPLRAATEVVCARDGVDESGLARTELLALIRDADAVRKAADVVMAQAAAEVDRRSRAEDGHAGLAAREGCRSAKELVARTTGGSMAQAQRLVDTGGLLADAGATGDGHGFGGGQPGERDDAGVTDSTAVADAADPDEPDEPDEPEEVRAEPLSPLAEVRAEVAQAAREGRIGVDVAALLTNTLAEMPDTPRTRDLFARALGKAPGLPFHQVRQLVWRAQASADPEAWEEREHRQHEARAVTVRDDADGMVTLTARLTPLAAAPVRAVLDAGVRRALQQRRDDPGSDPRSPWQMRVDLLTDMCQHMLDCVHTTTGVKTTVVVRMSGEELDAGVGVGEVDGTSQPVSVKALRTAAVDAEVIPAVLGGDGEVLDWGRAKRLFTPAQRLALAERDGGCAWCHAPPSWCEAHHLTWWKHGGRTDLSNGVLLCTRCHHRIHRDGWEITVTSGVPPGTQPEGPQAGETVGGDQSVWFTPPPSIDPARTPKLGGRARYEVREPAGSSP